MYKFKGPRDANTLRKFIEKNYNKVNGTVVPNELPTFFENLKEGMQQMIEAVVQIYQSDNNVAKIVLSFLFGIIFVLTAAVCFFSCYNSEPVRPSRVSSKRESTASQRESSKPNESRISDTGNETLKKRSTARRRD